MKAALLGVALFLGLSANAMEIGDTVPNLCWKNVQNQTVCLNDFQGKVKVLLFNAGWCGPCNSHMTALAHRVSQYNNKPVVFLSLSVSGWSHGSAASSNFLKEWTDKHKIPFPALAAGQSDLGKIFEPPHYIPSDAIVDADGKLAFRETGPSIEKLFSEVDEIMPEENPIVILPFPEQE